MKVETWLPVFSGFYNTIWSPEDKEEMELYHINEQRQEKKLDPVTSDECEFDYKEYELDVVKGIAQYLERELKGFVSGIKVQEVVSPKEYNFRNDSCDVIVTITKDNKKSIERYLFEHANEFRDYIKEKYTSYDGFISSYPNDSFEFLRDQPLKHSHKLGAILQFIAENEGIEEINIYYNVEAYVSASNYDELLQD